MLIHTWNLHSTNVIILKYRFSEEDVVGKIKTLGSHNLVLRFYFLKMFLLSIIFGKPYDVPYDIIILNYISRLNGYI